MSNIDTETLAKMLESEWVMMGGVLCACGLPFLTWEIEKQERERSKPWWPCPRCGKYSSVSPVEMSDPVSKALAVAYLRGTMEYEGRIKGELEA